VSRNPHQPTPETRRQVLTMTGLGIIQVDIGTMLAIDLKTLRKYYRRELDTGAIEANSRVASSLYTMATTDKVVAAAIFWMKARAGWKDHDPTPANHSDNAVILEVRWQPAQITDAHADTHAHTTIDADGPTEAVWQDTTC
jgi:hypothetical protein